MIGKPLSEVYAGVIPCEYAYFRRFMWAPPYDKQDWFAESMLAQALLQVSPQRPLRAGHKGLLLEAAKLFVHVFKQKAKDFYVDYGGTTDWSQGDLDALAAEIATYHTNDPNLHREVGSALRFVRRKLYITEVTEDGGHVLHTGEHEIEGVVRSVFDASLDERFETPVQTFERTLDYIDHLKGSKGYSSLFALKRYLTAYLRVWQCTLIDDKPALRC